MSNAKKQHPKASHPPAQKVPKIHPIIIYPFHQPSGYADLKCLYELVTRDTSEVGLATRRHAPGDGETGEAC